MKEWETSRPLLSVIIKTLNEEDNISACLASVLEATAHCRTQVIVADSRSEDATTVIAAEFGVNVVRLAPREPRGCGVGAQLGFQFSAGQYVLLMDGDMRLDPAFVPEALALLEADPTLAGVGGMVEFGEANLEYRLRRKRNAKHLRPGIVDRLDGGGLFRRAAIDEVDYLTNRNLHSYEEFDLALRLRRAGWRLRRTAATAVYHRGHEVSAMALLVGRWRSGYADGQGEAIRAALGSELLPLLREFWLSFAVIGWWGCLGSYPAAALATGLSLLPWPCLAMFPLAVMAVKQRSLPKACYSIALWQVVAAGLIRGLLRPQIDPRMAIAAEVVNFSRSFPVATGVGSATRHRRRPELPPAVRAPWRRNMRGADPVE